MIGFKLRDYQQSDLQAMVTLFNTTVRAINKKDYTEKQIEQWIQSIPDDKKLDQTFSSSYTCIAQLGNKMLGFGSISDSGYLEYLYVDREWIGYGIGKKLATNLIDHALKAGAKKITVHSSITAKPFFESLGFVVVEQRNNYRSNVLLINYLMVYEK
ncbi:GNAT family N-acetyltransferase [Candidatus Enterococcus mansonii]|uniref:N-acetyltransferase domain-containing protein n=1 Tax=Candidatus Enterococcus mansonii TaxID=1834181 RepID=A0A242CD39_9ENTE|nr:GNAT family N-acetyltransferase [Enterococcus sp. 4G2_DIV0659]OTO08184.1 hypothetical protein A5880_002454 [Enterococcus sp. 4G2_DIV0659]